MQEQNKNILKEFANQNDIDWRILAAILMKESNQKGFDKNGVIKSRYEKHIHIGFKNVHNGTKKRHSSLPGLDPVWIKSHVLSELELLSTSYGIAQIMGYWYKLLGYNSVGEMIESWNDSEEIQIRDFCLFCVRFNDGRFLNALIKQNLQSIAMQYNGKGYAQNSYDKDLQIYMQKQK